MAILYDALGNVIYPNKPTGSYLANISIRHSAADALGSSVWAMLNPTGSGKTIYIRNIRGRILFDGAVTATTSQGYEFIRYSGNVSPTTGTTIARIKKKTTYANSVVQDANIQQKSGILTLAGTFEGSPFNVVKMPISVTGGGQTFDIDLVVAGLSYEGFELAPGEGMAIRLHVAAVIGFGIAGSVEWDEV